MQTINTNLPLVPYVTSTIDTMPTETLCNGCTHSIYIYLYNFYKEKIVLKNGSRLKVEVKTSGEYALNTDIDFLTYDFYHMDDKLVSTDSIITLKEDITLHKNEYLRISIKDLNVQQDSSSTGLININYTKTNTNTKTETIPVFIPISHSLRLQTSTAAMYIKDKNETLFALEGSDINPSIKLKASDIKLEASDTQEGGKFSIGDHIGFEGTTLRFGSTDNPRILIEDKEGQGSLSMYDGKSKKPFVELGSFTDNNDNIVNNRTGLVFRIENNKILELSSGIESTDVYEGTRLYLLPNMSNHPEYNSTKFPEAPIGIKLFTSDTGNMSGKLEMYGIDFGNLPTNNLRKTENGVIPNPMLMASVDASAEKSRYWLKGQKKQYVNVRFK